MSDVNDSRENSLHSAPTTELASLSGGADVRPHGSDLIRPIGLVIGSGPEMTAEIRDLLHCRIRLAALVLFAGFALFLVRNLVWPEASGANSANLFRVHILITAILGVSGFSLCRRCEVSTLAIETARISRLWASRVVPAFHPTSRDDSLRPSRILTIGYQ